MAGQSNKSGDSTETSLIVRAKNSDAEAWERLSKLYAPVVYRWARQAGLQPDDASDVMQSVFESLTKNIVRFERRTEDDSFRGWLWTVTRNKVNDYFRTRQANANARGGTDAYNMLQQLAEAPSSADSDNGQDELSRLRRRALQLVQGDFEGRTWVAFWRTAVEGDSPADVAADMGISVWAVYKARTRVLQRLRDEFQDLLD